MREKILEILAKYSILPEAVSEKSGILGVRYSELTPLIINAVKELYQKWTEDSQAKNRVIAQQGQMIEKLQKENQELKTRMDRIEKAMRDASK